MKEIFIFLKSLFTSSDHKILQKMGYYLIRLGSKKIIVNFEYIEKLEKKKIIKILKTKLSLIHWKDFILIIQGSWFFFD